MPNALIERPVPGEASAEAFNYINLVPAGDVLALLKRQRDEARALFAGTSDEKSLYRYAAGKWSIRDMVNHMSDAERIFSYRALWFARALPHPLPDFDQEIAAPSAEADRVPWAALAEEFDRVRAATISLFDNCPPPLGNAKESPAAIRSACARWLTSSQGTSSITLASCATNIGNAPRAAAPIKLRSNYCPSQ
jgi:DinB superfamily